MALFDWGRKNLQILDFNFYLQIILFVVIFLIHQEKIKTSHHFWYNLDLLNTKPHYIDHLDQNYVLKYIE